MKVLMIVGSPKQNHSTSEKIGNHVCDTLAAKGHSITKVNAALALMTDSGTKTFVDSAKNADLLLFTFPLYVDSLPACLTKACEIFSKSFPGSGKKIAAISNSGFPEPFHNNSALEILKNFARQSGLVWVGGVSVGCGAALTSKKPMRLEEHGGMVSRLQKTLDLFANILANGITCSEYLETVAQPLPAWLYCMMGNSGWNKAAKRRGMTKKDLFVRPLLEVKL